MRVIDGAIFSRLSTGTALTSLLAGTASIYKGQAPEAATYPYVVFSAAGGGPDNDSPSDMRTEVYFVRGYATSSAYTASLIDEQVSALLHRNPLTVTGYTNFYVAREGEQELIETLPNGAPCWMSGAMYRIRID